MFCYQCGKELRENARFCFHCGAPVREIIEPASLTADPEKQESRTAESVSPKSPDTQETIPQEHSNAQESAPQAAPGAQESVPQEPSASSAGTSADLILKKGRVSVTGSELHLNRKHYIRKSGKKKFRKEKGPALIPLASIHGVFVEHHKYGGRLFLSLLLLCCCAAGAWYCAGSGYDAYNVLNIPYREKELAEQESIMAVIDGDGARQLLQYQNSQEENRSAVSTLSESLTGLEAQQTQEMLDAISKSDSFDLDAFFNRELFSLAYQEYLQDLLDAFKSDEAQHSWLYTYYETTKAYGGNYFLDTDLWIYSGGGDNSFSPILDSAASLMNEQYDLDLYEHIVFTGRIYISGADFMRVVLSLPRYTVEGAIFVKACGGVPEASEMSVPGWTRSHYEEFWLYGADYYSMDAPMWLDYGLSAGDFNLDWNTLTNESAYYDAYQNFMDKIAPGLPRHEIVSYQADDAAYGGMGYSLRGTEPSFHDLIASYAENHPEFIEELMANETYGKLLTTSVDEEIAEAKAQLEALEKEFLDLQELEKELSQLLADADIHRNDYALLLTDIEQHRQEVTRRLLFFSGASLLCLLGALFCLCKFFGFLKRPRHLFVVSGQEMDHAFHTRRFPGEQIEALQCRLSAGLQIPRDEVPAPDETLDEA